jgi:hypothetical protein
MARLSVALPLLLASACAEPAAHLELGGVEQALRPDDPEATGLLFRFAEGELVETYDSAAGAVRVHFTRAGVNAVLTSGDEVPADVVTVAEQYEAVLAHQQSLGFRAPLGDLGTPGGDGGDGRFDVYLLDFASRADGSFVREACQSAAPSRCSGYAVQENDFAGYRYPDFATGTRVLASHELFHAVQAAYDADQGANFGEATAVWASERFDPALGDFEAQIEGWLAHPERSIDQEPIMPVDPYSYGLALYVQYLDERFGAPLIREIWEGCEDGANGVADPRWLDVLAARLVEAHGTSFRDSWFEFARWALASGLAGPASESFTNGARYGRIARSAQSLPFSDDKLRMFHASLRAYTFEPDGRSELGVELVGDEATLEELGLVVATRRGDALSLTSGLAAAGALSREVAGADEVIMAVVNGAVSGQSKQPGLCIGTSEERARCRGMLAGDAGAGVADAGIPEAPGDESDGCSLGHRPGAGPGTFLALWAALASLSAVSRRRARRMW